MPTFQLTEPQLRAVVHALDDALWSDVVVVKRRLRISNPAELDPTKRMVASFEVRGQVPLWIRIMADIGTLGLALFMFSPGRITRTDDLLRVASECLGADVVASLIPDVALPLR